MDWSVRSASAESGQQKQHDLEAIARSLTDMGYEKTRGKAVQDQGQELDCKV